MPSRHSVDIFYILIAFSPEVLFGTKFRFEAAALRSNGERDTSLFFPPSFPFYYSPGAKFLIARERGKGKQKLSFFSLGGLELKSKLLKIRTRKERARKRNQSKVFSNISFFFKKYRNFYGRNSEEGFRNDAFQLRITHFCSAEIIVPNIQSS